MGRTYSRETLLAYAKFCEERDLHLVSDEIYALSTYSHPGGWRSLVLAGGMLRTRLPRCSYIHQYVESGRRTGAGDQV
jgi:hypothetical protein